MRFACEQAAAYQERDAELARLQSSPIGDEEASEYERRIEERCSESECAAKIAITFPAWH